MYAHRKSFALQLRAFTLPLIFMASTLSASALMAHCQIPCGIYDDPLRFALMEEHVATIEKSMRQIDQLSTEEQHDWNQTVRWVMNKDRHADELSRIVTYYFMAQRIKPVSPDDDGYAKYMQQVRLLHQLSYYAMKAKQTNDQEYVTKLRSLIEQLHVSYMGKSTPGHIH